MRRLFLVWSVAGLGCSFNSTGVTATGTGGAEESGETGSAASSGETSADSSSGGPAPTTGDPAVCEPGTKDECACESGVGEETCRQDGTGYDPCVCPGDETSATTASTTEDPSTTAVDPSTTTGGPETTTTSDETTTTSDDTTTTGDDTTGGEMCVEPDVEPNDDEASASPATDKTCKQNAAQFVGVLGGAGDVDWWEYDGTWSNGCGPGLPHPTHTLVADPGVRICVYIDCINDAAEMFDCGGAQDDTSPGGHPGCCVDGGGLGFELNCANEEESSHVFVRVDSAPDACVDYSVTYSYNDN